MFREQLHTAFDNISPSPELLDRVSAMMSEEVNKKKAPLKLNVVKYGGIAAALVLAAGGTLLVINNQNRGVKTSETANTAIAAGAAENFTDEEKKASQDSFSAQAEEAYSAQSEKTYSAQPDETYYAAAESTTAESGMPVTTSAVEVQTERAGEETRYMDIMPFGTTVMADDVPEAEENFKVNIAGNASDEPAGMDNAADEKCADEAAEIEAVPVADGENFDDACASDSATVDSCENTIPIVPSAMKQDEEAEKEAPTESVSTDGALSIGTPELIAAIKEALPKAAAAYNTFFGFTRDFEHEDLTDEQKTSLGFDTDRMYFKVTDERFDTWEELTAAWSGCFSGNAVEFLQANAPTQYFEKDGAVYACYVDGGNLGVDKMVLSAIYQAGDSYFTAVFMCYYEDELAPGIYDHIGNTSADFIKTENGLVLDSSDGWQDKWEWLFFCREFIFG